MRRWPHADSADSAGTLLQRRTAPLAAWAGCHDASRCLRDAAAASCALTRCLIAHDAAAFGTSQLCHVCGGHRVARESQSSYWCQPCGVVGDADPNAACNIAALTWQTLTRGEPVTMATMDSSPAARASPSKEERVGRIPAQQGNSTVTLDGCLSDAEFLPNKADSPTPGKHDYKPHNQ